MNFDIKQLNAFHTVAEELHFRRAADRLGMSQPMLTRLIRDLEDRLDAQLFVRNTRRVELTDAGRVFRQETRETVRRLLRAINITKNVATGRSGFLTLGVQDFFLMQGFPRIMRTFVGTCPEVACSVRDIASEFHAEALLTGTIDIGFPIAGELPSTVNSTVVERQRVVAVVHRESKLVGRSELDFEELADLPLIMWEEGMGRAFLRVIEERFRALQIESHIAHRFQSTIGMLGLVSAGMGVGIHIDSIRRHVADEVRCIPITNPEINIDTMMIWRKGPLPPAVRQMLDLVRGLGLPLSPPDPGGHP